MFKKPEDQPTAEVLSGVLGVTTAGGVLTFALFPLILPILVLTVVATLPLVAVALVAGALVGVVVVPIRLIARFRRGRPEGPRGSACGVSGRSTRSQSPARRHPARA